MDATPSVLEARSPRGPADPGLLGKPREPWAGRRNTVGVEDHGCAHRRCPLFLAGARKCPSGARQQPALRKGFLGTNDSLTSGLNAS